MIIGENRRTAVPEVVFSDRMAVELGGRRVELIHVGRGHSENTLLMFFPSERAICAVDFISVKRIPYRDLGGAWFQDWIDGIRRVEAIDFDILVPGHGAPGTKADAADHRRYPEALYEAAPDAMRSGLPLEEMQASIRLDQPSHFGRYAEWLPLNTQGVCRQVVLHRRGG